MLLELPDPCLLAVMQYCAMEQRSLFSAARAHSRLHQAAVLALCSIKAAVSQQKQVDSIVLYLSEHGQHIDSIDLQGDKDCTPTFQWLPPMVQLSSLKLQCLRVQLHVTTHNGLGLLAGTPPLKQLRLSHCRLLDDAERLAAALEQLPKLQHLSVEDTSYIDEDPASKDKDPTQVQPHTLASVLQQLQGLTYLQLDNPEMFPGQLKPNLQQLKGLTRLADLRLELWNSDSFTANMLFSAYQLTRLHLPDCEIEPGALAGKTQLQHLHFNCCSIAGGAAGVAKLLLHLQHMQQLTYLDLEECLSYDWLRDAAGDVLLLKQEGNSSGDNRVANPPAAAFSALTASSKLEHLNISRCSLPLGVWPNIFPANRQLPHLRAVNVGYIRSDLANPRRSSVCVWDPPLDGCQLVSCCPSLQSLNLSQLPFRQELLAPLRGLSSLHTLRVSSAFSKRRALGVVCQLTALQELEIYAPRASHPGLLDLTQLKQLTRLSFSTKGAQAHVAQAPGGRPVWRHLVQLNLDEMLKHLYGPSSTDPAQLATAALAQ